MVQQVLTITNKLNPKRIKQFNLTQFTPKDFYLAFHECDVSLCDNPNCKNYGKELPFKTFTTGFADYCDKECANSSSKRTTKIKETNLEKYGNEVVMNASHNVEKRRNNNLEKYGVLHYTQSEDFKNKSMKTVLDRYGVTNISQDEQIKLKKIETCLERYGVDNPSQHKDIQLKKIETSINRYNNKHYMGSDIQISTWEQPVRIHITNLDNLNQEYLDNNFVIDGFFDVQSAMEYFNVSYNMFARTKTRFNLPPFLCNYGKTQNQIFDLFDDALLNDRQFINPLEIDILSHEHKLGVEYNGLMFHSYGKSKYSKFNNYEKEDRNYHLLKTQLMEDKGYQLFHIFENEWLTQKEIWTSMINAKIGKSIKIFARKTIIKEVHNTQAKQFLIENHIQGYCNSNINYGLYYNEELVALMTFGKSRFSKKYEYELLRFCNIRNTTVVGGFSKLLKHFERVIKPSSIVSYANRRWSTGNVYEKNGFEFSHNSSPNYFYFKDDNELVSRNKFQKHKLKKLLENFNEKESESQNMFNHGYRRIWDSGNKVYYKEYNEEDTNTSNR
jgi:hypothetical protein